MPTTSTASDDVTGNPAPPSSQAMIGNAIQQQQPIPQPIPQPLQQIQASSGSPPTTTIHYNTPHQPLFLKPHPTILPTHSTTSTDIPTTTANTASPPKLPLATATSHTSPSTSTTTINPHFVKGEGVKEPLPTDVICGRGKMTASHPANRRFRELVDSHKASYQNSKRRDEKTRITCELVDKLRGEGRFVLFDPNTKLWHEVSEEYAREKVSHSLRSRSSTEQRIANAASNSIKMLNHAVNEQEVVNIAPRGNLLVPKKVESSASPAVANANSTKSKPNLSTSHKPKTAALAHRKKKVAPVSKTRSSKHLKPGLDEIVKRLIEDQQKLLRMMIQKETDRFTSAAALGSSSQPPPMPLTYKADASAVSKLTTSLPKLGAESEAMTGVNAPTAAAAAANASDAKASPNSETPASAVPPVAA